MTSFFLRKFTKDTSGNVGLMFGAMLVPLVAIGGAGVDLAHYESVRMELQDSLDHGVLAAASLGNAHPTDQTIRDYMKNLPYAKDVVLTHSQKSETASRSVQASASYVVKTSFMHLVGVDKLTVNVSSTATHAAEKVELSLLLDVSASMSKGPAGKTRFDNMQKAAQEFIDEVLTDKNKDFTTISIVPYAGHVNVGKTVFDALSDNRYHDESSCYELGESNSDYGADPINFKKASQVPHFAASSAMKGGMRLWCPRETSAIAYFSNDADALKARIKGLTMHFGTGTQNAMQWGYTLLNPAATSSVVRAADTGKHTPAPFDDPNTKKFIVLMTDGAISHQRRPDRPSPPASDLDHDIVSNRDVNAERLHRACRIAKSKRITIFTIGFEVDDNVDEGTGRNAATDMIECASSRGHYYAASGIQISEAFKSIAVSMKKLRLTQ